MGSTFQIANSLLSGRQLAMLRLLLKPRVGVVLGCLLVGYWAVRTELGFELGGTSWEERTSYRNGRVVKHFV